MYRRPKFLEVVLEIRQEMARQSDYDVDLFAELIRSGKKLKSKKIYNLNEPEIESESSRNSKGSNK